MDSFLVPVVFVFCFELHVGRDLAELRASVFHVSVSANDFWVAMRKGYLVGFVDGVGPRVLECASVVNVRVAIAPLVFNAYDAFLVVPVIVGASHRSVLLSVFGVEDRVRACDRHAVFVRTSVFTVSVGVDSLAGPFGFGGSFFILTTSERARVFAVPRRDVHRLLCARAGDLVFVGEAEWYCFFPVHVLGACLFNFQCVTSVGWPFEVGVMFVASD